MDSGCTVPTLSSGLRETVALKLLTVASGRCGAVAGAGVSGRAPRVSAATGFRLRLRARRLALDKAGSNSAAMTAMMVITTMSYMRVKADVRIFIEHPGCSFGR